MPDILDRVAGDSCLMYRLRIDPGLSFFEGHFPGFPIVPGVVQIDWAIELGAALLDPAASFRTMHRVKFMRPITGNTDLELLISVDAGGDNLTFRYYDNDFVYSSGRLAFGR